MARRPRETVLRASRPNAGLEALYRKRLLRLVDEMGKSVDYWMRAAYRADPPEMLLAQDASPARELSEAVQRLAKRWTSRFDSLAEDLGKWFSKSVGARSDASLQSALRKGGFSVKFRFTPAARDVLNAVTAENVALIKSIPAQYFTQIEGMVMRSAASGRDLYTLSKDLHEQFGVTRRRAALIARDQSNKATSAMTRARQTELGITEAIWMHSHGGKKPRPTHLANDGKRYDVTKGWYDPAVKKWIFPGELVNCFPEDTLVGLEARPVALWRALFNGPVVHLQVGPDLLKGTFNHPVLTARGWVPLGLTDRSDQVVCMLRQEGQVIDDHEDNRKSTFGQLFETYSRKFGNVSRNGAGFDFHGDRPSGDVDEVIVIHDELPLDRNAPRLQDFSNLAFAQSNRMDNPARIGVLDHVLSPSLPCVLGSGPLLLDWLPSRPHEVGIGAPTHCAVLDEDISNVARRVTRDSEFLSDGCGAQAALVHCDDLRGERIPVPPSINMHALSPELFAQFVRIAANSGRRIFQFGARLYEFRGISDKSVRDFSGHVFTMQTRTGFYSVGGAFVQAKNCRCVSRSVIPGFS